MSIAARAASSGCGSRWRRALATVYSQAVRNGWTASRSGTSPTFENPRGELIGSILKWEFAGGEFDPHACNFFSNVNASNAAGFLITCITRNGQELFPGGPVIDFPGLGGVVSAITRAATGTPDTITMRDFRILLGYERKIIGGLSSRCEFGYVFGRELEFAGGAPDVTLDDTLFVRAGFSY